MKLPTNDVNKRLSSLSSEKRALFDMMLRRNGSPKRETASGDSSPADLHAEENTVRPTPENCSMEFSFMFFSDNGCQEGDDKYDLLVEAARFADAHRFNAVWVPERHFHAFGGLFPNPSLIAAALAMVTSHIELRAGSVVLPLHDPLRVAEEWAIVDNLSKGRAAISFASGWHEKDFVLAPGRYKDRKEITYAAIDTVRKLWRGEAIRVPGIRGQEVEVQAFPRPVRRDVPLWITSAGSIDTFLHAGKMGLNLLTGLTGHSLEELSEKIALYKKTLAENGHDPSQAKIALMLHTFLGDNVSRVMEQVREPMYEYLRTNMGLHKELARSRNSQWAPEKFNQDDEKILLQFSFERYSKGSALFGTADSCMGMVQRVKQAGITEIACLLDFGLDRRAIIDGLPFINELKERCTFAEDRMHACRASGAVI